MTSADLDAIQCELSAQLPMRARWLLAEDETLWDWDFSRSRSQLRPLEPEEIVGTVMPADWGELFLFGRENFAEGGGASPFVGVHLESGAVLGLDLERDASPIYLLNSSVHRFIETFLLLDQILGPLGLSSSGLADRVRAIDPEAFDRSEWSDLVLNIDPSLKNRAVNTVRENEV